MSRRSTTMTCVPRSGGIGARHPLAAAVAIALASAPVGAATLAVDGTACTLADALTAANTDTAAGGCAAGSGPDTLLLAAPAYVLGTVDNTAHGANGLPAVISLIRIDGDPDGDGKKAVIRRSRQAGTPPFRLLTVSETGVLTLDHVELNNGSSDSGGGLYNVGITQLTACTVSGNRGSGVVNRGGEVTLRNSVVSNNSGNNGGGLDNQTGTMTLIDSLVSGNEAVYGGGARNASGTLTLRTSKVTRNRASYDGGGLYNFNGQLAVIDSTLSGNDATYYGGGLFNFGEAKLTRTTVSRNAAYAGGGLANDDGGSLTLLQSTVSGNDADEFGGGLVNGRRFYGEEGGSVAILASTFHGNDAGYGGGAILNWDGPLSLANSTLSGNAAGWVGGAIYNSSFRYDGRLTVRNSTVTGNRAEGHGGALYMYFDGRLTLINSIFANSIGPGPDCYKTDSATLEFAGINLIEDGSCGVSDHGGIQGDPRLGRLLDNGGPTLTHALRDGSPAIDAADESLCRQRDQRGIARPQGAACDIGAFERVEVPAAEVVSLTSIFDEARAAGELTGTGASLEARALHLESVRHQLLLIGELGFADQRLRACEPLVSVRKRIDIDGSPNRGDYVTGPGAGGLAGEIEALLRERGCG